ncbi:MAG: sigma-70 family RNA polymerase sigma factor [Bacteroidota bacterium]
MSEDYYHKSNKGAESSSGNSDISDIRALYLAYYNPLFRYGCSIEAHKEWVHDEIQELFVWLIQHPEKWSQIQNLKAYLFKSLRRNIRAKAKQQRTKSSRLDDWQEREKWEEAPQEMALIAEENEKQISEHLAKGLGKLSSHQREVIFLRFYQSMSYDEIADIFSVSNQVVRNTVFRAIKNLRKYVSDPKNLGTLGLLATMLPS